MNWQQILLSSDKSFYYLFPATAVAMTTAFYVIKTYKSVFERRMRILQFAPPGIAPGIVDESAPGVLNFMLSMTRFATFMFYWCGVRQVRFKNRYLTVFHTWVMFMSKLSIFRRFTSMRWVTVRNFWAIILLIVGPTLGARWMSRSME